VLLVNGRFECFMLEDEIREVKGRPVSEWKQRGSTAIPAGRYKVTITQSPKFKRRLPLLHAVPGFTGIRMHPGNSHVDTDGCLLPGRTRGPAFVGESRLAFNALFKQLDSALSRKESVAIVLENP
jgi:hypothetical protein